MKSKVLIIGGLPLPQEGPWVTITDGGVWGHYSPVDFGGDVVIEVKKNGSTVRYPVKKGWTKFEGDKARVVVLDEVSSSVSIITVEISCLRLIGES